MASIADLSALDGTVAAGRRLDEVQAPSAQVTTVKRRLAFTQLSTPPPSRYTVEACASIAGLSANKKAALAAEGLTRCVNALGLLITSNAACNCDNNLLTAANFVSEILDTDLDGKADLETTVNTYVNNFDGGDNPKPLQVCGASAADESLTTNSDYLGYSMSCQAWKFSDIDTAVREAGTKKALKEEVFHLVQQYVWANAYPDQFGLNWNATHCTSLKAAQCRWWQHSENIGCRDSDGTACISIDETAGKIVPDAASAAYNVPGQCFGEIGTIGEATCAIASCDCLEWFHKLYLCYIEDPTCYVYGKSQGAAVDPTSESNSQLGVGGFPIYDWAPDNKAAYKSSVETQLGLTPEGRALLAVMQNAAGTYKLPKVISGTYTAVFGVSPSPSSPPPAPSSPAPMPTWVAGAGATPTATAKCDTNVTGTVGACASRNDGQCDDGGANPSSTP